MKPLTRQIRRLKTREHRLEEMVKDLLTFDYLMRETGVSGEKHDKLLRRARKQVGWKAPKPVDFGAYK